MMRCGIRGLQPVEFRRPGSHRNDAAQSQGACTRPAIAAIATEVLRYQQLAVRQVDPECAAPDRCIGRFPPDVDTDAHACIRIVAVEVTVLGPVVDRLPCEGKLDRRIDFEGIQELVVDHGGNLTSTEALRGR
jgi:hypothetical protein